MDKHTYKNIITGTIEVNQLSAALVANIKAQDPKSNPKEWQVMNGDDVHGYFDTYDEAKDAAKNLDVYLQIEEKLEAFVGSLMEAGYEWNDVIEQMHEYGRA